jgi:hypothetical protein
MVAVLKLNPRIHGDSQMTGKIQKVLIGASVLASVSAIANSPAFAISITPTSLTGNFLIYDSDATNTFQVPYTGLTQAENILKGSCTVNAADACDPPGSPTGNIELFADSETGTYSSVSAFLNAPVSSLKGTLFGQEITLSSLTGKDWFGPSGNTTYGAATLATEWFNAALTNNGFASAVNTTIANFAFNSFLEKGGFQRFSDPNLSYVTQETPTSGVLIGLAGHYDATDLLLSGLSPVQKTIFLRLRSPDKKGQPIQLSELVNVTYGGKTGYHYSFNAANSGFTETSDQRSHNGNYEVDPLPPVPPTQSVPEPSALLGIVGLGGFFLAKRKLVKNA